MRGYLGTGSQTSPILISDDEDGMTVVSGQSLSRESSANPNYNSPVSQYSSQRRSYNDGQQVLEKRDFTGNNRRLGEDDMLKARKRKREQLDISYDVAGPSRLHSLSSPPATRGKRTKRQGRVIRRQNNEVPHRQLFDDAAFDILNSDSFIPPYLADTYLPSVPMTDDLQTSHVRISNLSSSQWVNSMAKAADPSDMQNSISVPWDNFVSSPWTSQPLFPDLDQLPTWPSQPDQPIPPSTLPQKPVQVALPVKSVSSDLLTDPSKKLLLTNIIGMPYAKDPEGKRGGFKLSSTTVFESKPHIVYPHAPDPSRSLIMDQLPKLSRTPQWLKSWTEDACGAQPIFLAIDSSSAKALLEFSSVDQAEKAWNSPKLGKGLGSLAPTELKGKPRVDLIRVWWYRSPSSELVFTRKELEEGEIEDVESMVDGRKESKKEKRTRLAKLAKEEKMKGQELVELPAKSRDSQLSSSSAESPFSYTQDLNTWPPSISMSTERPFALTTHALPAAPIVLSTSFPTNTPMPVEHRAPTTITRPDIRRIEDETCSGNASTGRSPTKQETTAMNLDPSPSSGSHTDDIVMELSSPSQPSLIPASTSVIGPVDKSMVDTVVADTVSVTLSEDHADGASADSSVSREKAPISTVIRNPSPQKSSIFKRSLLARQKELEERIARSKLEIERNQTSLGKRCDTQSPIDPIPTLASVTSSSPLESPRSPLSSSETNREPSLDRQAIEVHLRRVVLASQKKNKIVDPVTILLETTVGHVDVEPLRPKSDVAVISDPPSYDTGIDPPTPSTTTGVVFDDLAVSFIQESIQTVRPTQSLPAPPIVSVRPPNNSFSGLAARREELEHQIAETKRLMGSLSQTTTKQGRDSIMTQIRELNRSQKQAVISRPTLDAVQTPAYPSFLVKQIEPTKSLWPESVPDGGIFILSDDDDDD